MEFVSQHQCYQQYRSRNSRYPSQPLPNPRNFSPVHFLDSQVMWACRIARLVYLRAVPLLRSRPERHKASAPPRQSREPLCHLSRQQPGPSLQASKTAQSSSPAKPSSGLNVAAKVAIGVLIPVFIVLCLLFGILLWRRVGNRKKS